MGRQILLAAAYGTKNVGDEAILAGLINILGRENIFKVFSSDPAETERYHKVRASRKNLLDLARSQEVVIGGGQLIQDGMALRYSVLAILSKLMGKKCSFYAIGASPLKSGVAARITKMALNFADIVSVRDEGSLATLKKMGVQKEIKIVSDPFFSMEESSAGYNVDAIFSSEQVRRRGLPLIGISLRGGESAVVDERAIAFFSKYYEAISEFADVIFLIFSKHPASKGDNDLVMADKLQSSIAHGHLNIIRGDYPPQAYFSIMKSLDLLVSVRLHPILFATRANVPALGIDFGTNSKIRPFAKRHGIPVYGLERVEEVAAMTKEIIAKPRVTQRNSD